MFISIAEVLAGDIFMSQPFSELFLCRGISKSCCLFWFKLNLFFFYDCLYSGFNFSIWPFDRMHLIHFRLHFTWDNVPFPRCCVDTFWSDQVEFQGSHEMVTFVSVSIKPLLLFLSNYNFNFGFFIFYGNSKILFFFLLVFPDIFCLICWAAPALISGLLRLYLEQCCLFLLWMSFSTVDLRWLTWIWYWSPWGHFLTRSYLFCPLSMYIY